MQTSFLCDCSFLWNFTLQVRLLRITSDVDAKSILTPLSHSGLRLHHRFWFRSSMSRAKGREHSWDDLHRSKMDEVCVLWDDFFVRQEWFFEVRVCEECAFVKYACWVRNILKEVTTRVMYDWLNILLLLRMLSVNRVSVTESQIGRALPGKLSPRDNWIFPA